jgi:hypothetical protein
LLSATGGTCLQEQMEEPLADRDTDDEAHHEQRDVRQQFRRHRSILPGSTVI